MTISENQNWDALSAQYLLKYLFMTFKKKEASTHSHTILSKIVVAQRIQKVKSYMSMVSLDSSFSEDEWINASKNVCRSIIL